MSNCRRNFLILDVYYGELSYELIQQTKAYTLSKFFSKKLIHPLSLYIHIYMYISIANVCLTCSMYNHLITNKKNAPAFREAAPPFCLFESGQVSAVFVWFWSSGESSVWHCKICIKSTSTEPQQRQWIPPVFLIIGKFGKCQPVFELMYLPAF